MKTASINHKMSFLLLTLIFIGFSTALISCDSISTDTKDKIKSEAQELENKLKQELETGLEQAELISSPQIATVKGLWVSHLCPHPTPECLYVELKPTTNAVANKTYIVSIYEQGRITHGTVVQWNQPELNVLKEKTVHVPISEKECDAYSGEDISHIFTIKVHE